MNALRISVLLHRWSGLALALFVLTVSVSGALLVFRPELDRWLNPDLFVIEAGGHSLPATAIVERVTDRYPQMRPSGIILPDALSAVWRVLLETRPGHPSQPALEVFVDPHRGVLLGSRRLEGGSFDRRTFLYYVRIFHYNLLLKTPMYRVLGAVALIWLITSIFGLYLAWPRRGTWRRVFSIKLSMGALRGLFDAHRSLGVLSLVVLLPILITSLWWNLDFLMRPLVHAVLPTTGWLQGALSHAGHHGSSEDSSAPVRPSLDEVAMRACSADASGCTRVLFDHHQERYQVWLGHRAAWQGEWLAPDMSGGGSAIQFYSMRDGAQMNTIDVGSAQPGDKYAALQYPLHTGAFFGLPGRLLWVLAGLAPVVLSISGFYVWLKRRKAVPARKRT